MAKEVERSGILAQYPHIDGVIALVHGTGCGMADKGPGFEALKPHAVGLCHEPEHRRRAARRARLRGLPDRPP